MAYKKNFNKNYNRNRNNRYNGGQGYNNDNKKFYYMDRPQEQQPTFNGFDATQYIKPEINIKDMNGKVYTISGNFSTIFTEELVKAAKKVEEILKNDDVELRYSESLAYLKNWCLLLLNQNVNGEKYKMEDVECGFNDVVILRKLFIYISEYIKKNVNDEN